MPVRPVRLLTAILLGASVATAAFAASQPLTWSGDIVSAHAVVEGLARAWQRSGHGRMSGSPFNTDAGIDAVSSGRADIAGSVRGSDGSAEDSRLSFTPVAWDGLVIITGAGNPVNGLTLKQLHDIYYGLITNWNQVGGPDAPIHVVAVASPDDGVEYSLRQLLFGRGNQPVAAPRLYLTTTDLEQGVALDSQALGVATLSSVLGNPRLKMLRIDGSAPTLSSVASGRYPLYTPIYLVTNPDDPNAAEVRAFISFATSTRGGRVLREHRVLPYADGAALAAMDHARRARILAEVGAHSAVPMPMPSAPLAAPGAAYASRATGTSTARRAPFERRTPTETSVNHVRSSVVAAAVPQPKPSLAHVQADVVTVAAAGSLGPDFRRVRAESCVTADRIPPAHDEDAHRPAEHHEAQARVHHRAEGSTYRVRSGDTLYSIARRHGVDVQELRRWNHLRGNDIRLGQVLRLNPR